tara:strand:+ start:104 stop:679 length:576 start_codon:yes stop_codon:yes gene_type:complete
MLYRDYRYVENYPGYIISNFGEVFSTKREKVIQLKGMADNDGYLRVNLYNKTHKTHRIHILVGNVFVGLRTGELTFDHIDRDRANNRADNIRLATRFEQGINKGLAKNNKLGFKNIIEYIDNRKRVINKYYELSISRNKKRIFRQCYKKSDYTIEDVVKIRDDIIAKYNHEVCLNKVHLELLSITDFVRSV